MSSKYNRSYVNCWNQEKIQQVLEDRLKELKGPDKKSKSRIKLLKTKITKLKKALEGKGIAGGQISPKEGKKNKEKDSKRLKKKVKKRIKKICFKCKKINKNINYLGRKKGHLLQDCKENENEAICFSCGSKDHTLKDCKNKNKEELPFATCFVCNKSGHLASQCNENPKGIFPKGSGCYFCGSVKHKKADCPEYKNKSKKAVYNNQDTEL